MLSHKRSFKKSKNIILKKYIYKCQKFKNQQRIANEHILETS